MEHDRSNLEDCRVCSVEHDEEIHAATLRLRMWFHDQVTQGFRDLVEEETTVIGDAQVMVA